VTLHEIELEASKSLRFGCAIRSGATALPSNYVSQAVLTATLRELWRDTGCNAARFARIQEALGVEGRYLSLPLEEYRKLDSFAKCNDTWLQIAPELAESAIRKALDRARLEPDEIDHIFFVTVTGIAIPSLDARLANRIGMRRDVRRTPIFGLGCAAGAGAIGRAADYLHVYPKSNALIVSVELCSLTLQRLDISAANMIASGLFGDGAAAIILGARLSNSRLPQVVDSRSLLYPNTEQILGWDLVETGFKIVLSARLPELIRTSLRADVDAFLEQYGLRAGDIDRWIVHPGGPKIIGAVQDALGLDQAALLNSRRFLRRTGNLSSASVLFLLEETLYQSSVNNSPEWGLVLAMGPGFGVEMVLIRWDGV
jgi:alkylresorcinol/alkylpyrone synthase